MVNKRYGGTARKIVFAFDVGTTQTGISYCVLEPGEVPQKKSMHKFPGQEYTIGSHKIPTVMYYNKDGHMVSAGAESLADEVTEKAEEEGWIKVQWFKLRLRPRDLAFDFNNTDLGSLPHGKTIDDIYADFYSYLLKCCEYFIKETHPTYASSWEVLLETADFVFCHPNGWKGAQQERMRQAAIKASLVPDTEDGRDRIQFVTEGEASLHYCVEEKHLDLNDEGLIVADLGGGTLDFSTYNIHKKAPLTVHESTSAKCVLEGSEIITKRAREYITDKLRGSKYGSDEAIDGIVKAFDNRTKRVFRNESETVYLPFGMVSFKDPAFGITGGKLKLTGEEVANFFEPSIAASEKLITKGVLSSPVKISAVYLVGGLSGSTFVKSELTKRFTDANLEIRAPGDTSVKAAAMGALGFYLDHYVEARIAKYDYGMKTSEKFDHDNADHARRVAHCFTWASGEIYVSGLFSTILSKGTAVKEKSEFVQPYFREILSKKSTRNSFLLNEKVITYTGSKKSITWVNEAEKDELQTACTIRGDLSALRSITRRKTNAEGKEYQMLVFEVVLLFGGPELKAKLRWRENGLVKCGPASIIYDDDCVLNDDQ